MILYHAIGGGLGHATRARRVLDALGLDATILTSADVPPDLAHRPAAHRAWTRDFVRAKGVERVLADTFPGGIQGELCGLDDVRIDHVARILRWDQYRRAVPDDLPPIHTTYLVEELTPEHDAFVRGHSRRVATLSLLERRPRSPRGAGALAGGYWLIVHSGPEHEVRELVEFAQDLGPPAKVLVATPCAIELPAGFQRVDAYPAHPLFADADRILSGAGFNVMLETEPWRDKHLVLPFPRRFDDQFLRAARRQKAAHQQRAGHADRAAEHRQ